MSKLQILLEKRMIEQCTRYLRDTPGEAFEKDHIRELVRIISEKDSIDFMQDILLEDAPERLLKFMQTIPGENFTDEQVAHLMALCSQIEEQYEDSLPTYEVKKSPFNEGTFGVVDRVETERTDLEDYWVADKLDEVQAARVAFHLNNLEEQRNAE